MNRWAEASSDPIENRRWGLTAEKTNPQKKGNEKTGAKGGGKDNQLCRCASYLIERL